MESGQVFISAHFSQFDRTSERSSQPVTICMRDGKICRRKFHRDKFCPRKFRRTNFAMRKVRRKENLRKEISP